MNTPDGFDFSPEAFRRALGPQAYALSRWEGESAPDWSPAVVERLRLAFAPTAQQLMNEAAVTDAA